MKTLKYLFACLLVIAFASFVMAETSISPILENARATNTLRVGIDAYDTIGMLEGHIALGEFPNNPNVPTGLEADIARAIAAAIDVGVIEWVRVDGNDYEDRWAFLNNGIVDVVICQSTLTSIRDTKYADTGFEWSPIYYYDGTKVLLAPERMEGVARYNIYVQDQVSNYYDLLAYEASGNMPANWDIVVGNLEPQTAFEGEYYDGKHLHGVCSDGIKLASVKTENLPNEWYFYDKTLSKSPFAVASVEDDENFAEIVRWTMNVLFEAEDVGYGKGNIPPIKWGPTVPGLEKGWAKRVIYTVGNYKDIFERAFGVGADRGLNKLWKDCGLQYSPPF